MGFLKLTTIFFAAFFVAATCAILPAITNAQSIDYRFEPNSTYSYQGGFSPNIVFDLTGTFTLNRTPTAVTISNANFQLETTSALPVPTAPLYTADGLEDFLEADVFQFPSFASSGGLYFGTAASDPLITQLGEYSIAIDNTSQLTLTGFGNPSGVPIFADGDQFDFSATAVAVPEPAGLPACLLLAVTFIGKRRRGASRSHC